MKKPDTKKKNKRAVKRKAAKLATKKLTAKQNSHVKKVPLIPIVKKTAQKKRPVAKKVSKKAKRQELVVSKKVRVLEILIGFSGFSLGGLVVASKIPLFIKIFV